MKHDKDHYLGAIIEDIQSTVHHIAEALMALSRRADRIDKRLINVEDKIDLMIPILKTSVKDHERRIKKLETMS